MSRFNAKTVLLVMLCTTVGCKNYTSRSAGHNTAGSPHSNSQITQATNSTVPIKDSKPQCDPNYSPCVPIASDVDCAGGRGDGPAYVKGPVRVIGKDIYGLDKDHDGIGCER